MGYCKENYKDSDAQVPRCAFCKRPGHKFYHCWEYRAHQSRKCYECGEVGHIRRDCPLKKYSCVRCGNAGHYARDCENLPPKSNKGPQRKVYFGPNEVFEVERFDIKEIWKVVLEEQKALKASEEE